MDSYTVEPDEDPDAFTFEKLEEMLAKFKKMVSPGDEPLSRLHRAEYYVVTTFLPEPNIFLIVPMYGRDVIWVAPEHEHLLQSRLLNLQKVTGEVLERWAEEQWEQWVHEHYPGR